MGAAVVGTGERQRRRPGSDATTEVPLVRRVVLAVALTFLAAVVVAPLGAVLVGALESGIGLYVRAIADPAARDAIELTLFVAAVVVPVNVVFGLAAAWLLAKYRFRGRSLLVTLVDLPFSVSPVVAGLLFVLLFGRRGWFGPWLAAQGVSIVFATPGIVLATLFVTFPFVAREVLAVMEVAGSDEEEAATTLGAGGLQTFVRVTLPKIRWGLLYGVVLCNARAMGEFGAVSVVSGRIRGLTTTMPLHIEMLYDEYDFIAAFAVSSLLTCLAVVTLVVKKLVSRRSAA